MKVNILVKADAIETTETMDVMDVMDVMTIVEQKMESLAKNNDYRVKVFTSPSGVQSATEQAVIAPSFNSKVM